MGMMASQITSLTIVYSIVYSGADQRKHRSSASLAFVREFPAQMASNAENVSIWWRHHDRLKTNAVQVARSLNIINKCRNWTNSSIMTGLNQQQKNHRIVLSSLNQA